MLRGWGCLHCVCPCQHQAPIASHAVAAAARVLTVLPPLCRRCSLGRCCEGQPGDLRLQTAGPVRQPGEAQGSAKKERIMHHVFVEQARREGRNGMG